MDDDLARQVKALELPDISRCLRLGVELQYCADGLSWTAGTSLLLRER